MEWLGTNQIPFSIIFTKADKLKPLAVERNVKRYLEKMEADLWEEAPPHFISSSLHKTGIEKILTYIGQLNNDFKAST